MAHHLFTSESVTEGHPDKICDQVSDAILDAILAQDPNGRVACECTVTTGVVNVMGEITTECYVDIPKVVRQTVRDNIAAAKAPRQAVICPCCGASTFPDASGCCEYCGSPVK